MPSEHQSTSQWAAPPHWLTNSEHTHTYMWLCVCVKTDFKHLHLHFMGHHFTLSCAAECSILAVCLWGRGVGWFICDVHGGHSAGLQALEEDYSPVYLCVFVFSSFLSDDYSPMAATLTLARTFPLNPTTKVTIFVALWARERSVIPGSRGN